LLSIRERIVRSAIVQGMSRFSSDVIISSFDTPFDFEEFVKEGFSYKYLRPTNLLTSYLQTFLPFIFYAQFGYLYSFTPTKFDKTTIDNLVKQSLERNKREVQNIYQQLRDGYVTFFTAKTMSFMRFNKQTSEITKIADASEMRKI
jgi:hypothetical protein